MLSIYVRLVPLHIHHFPIVLISSPIYKDIAIIFRTQLTTKNTVTFFLLVVVFCKLVSFVGYDTGKGFSAIPGSTFGNHLLERCAGSIAIVPKFQKYP